MQLMVRLHARLLKGFILLSCIKRVISVARFLLGCVSVLFWGEGKTTFPLRGGWRSTAELVGVGVYIAACDPLLKFLRFG